MNHTVKKSYATMRRIRRNRIIAGAGSVLGVALVAGGAILLMNMTDASDIEFDIPAINNFRNHFNSFTGNRNSGQAFGFTC